MNTKLSSHSQTFVYLCLNARTKGMKLLILYSKPYNLLSIIVNKKMKFTQRYSLLCYIYHIKATTGLTK